MASAVPKILLISTMGSFPWGGSEELWSQAAARLRGSGAQVAVCVKGWDQPVPQVEALRRSGCEVRVRRPATRLERLVARLSGVVINSDAKWVKQSGADLVVISQGGSWDGVHWARMCIEASLPYVLITHSAAPHSWPSDERARQIAGVYEAARCCYFVSNASLKLVREQLAGSSFRTKVVRNPFNVPYQAGLAWPISRATMRFACVGRLENGTKGYDLVLKVLAMEKWRARSLQVTFHGEGPNREALERVAVGSGLRNVSYVGETADVEGVWRSNHALLMPSRQESMPLVLVEAMLCSRVAVATNVGGITELLEDNVTGFIAKAPTVELLEEAMERAWERRNDWEAMGILAAKRVRELVPPDPVAEFVKELQSLIA